MHYKHPPQTYAMAIFHLIIYRCPALLTFLQVHSFYKYISINKLFLQVPFYKYTISTSTFLQVYYFYKYLSINTLFLQLPFYKLNLSTSTFLQVYSFYKYLSKVHSPQNHCHVHNPNIVSLTNPLP